MSDTENKYIVLFEYDKPLDMDYLLNYEAGVWYFVMSPGDVDVTDDNANTGYYPYTNDILYNIKSLRVDDENYSATESYADMLVTNKSFYYDRDGTGAGSDLIGGEELYADFSDSADMGKDYSAGGNDGTATAVTQVTGPFDYAGSFNGSTSQIEIDDSSDLPLSSQDSWTICFWVKYDYTALSGNFRGIFNKGLSAPQCFARNSADSIGFKIQTSVNNTISLSGVGDDSEHFIICEFDYSTRTMSVSKDLETPSTLVIEDYDNSNVSNFFWGSQNGVAFFTGTLSDPRAFPRILSEAERTNLYLYNKIKKPTSLYIHFDGWEPPLDRQIFAGGAVGYTWGLSQSYYYNNVYYEPLVSKIFNIKKSKDPLFFGVLKMQTGTVELINMSDRDGVGYLDDWRDRNLFAQACRLMVGQYDDAYEDFEQKFTGNIEDDSRTWESLKVKLADIRKGLTRSIADNLLTLDDYPDLNDDNVDKPKPIAYGEIFNAESINLNQEETGSPATYTFLLCDTEFNDVDSLDAVYVEGTEITPTPSLDASAGTFTLTRTQLTIDGDFDESYEVTADFEVAINNGVSIIKDLIENYDGKPFLSTFWDTTEVNTAASLARNTSVYVDDDKKLQDVIKNVSSDIDGLFFAKDNGKYTVRIYDENRTPTKTILEDEWIDTPDIDNNASKFLTSVVIKYRHDQTSDTWRQYENTDYIEETFSTYKRYKKATFETGLTTEADAIEKSETILGFSSNVQDIVQRSTKWQHSDLEIMDFVICDPVSRISGTQDQKVYEVVGRDPVFSSMTVKLSLRYVKEYTPTVETYFSLIGNGDYITDDSGNTIIGGE